MSERLENPRAAATVLVVEDEPNVCALISDMLEDEGYQVVCTGNDVAAYRALAGTDFDALVVDINLGRGTTGFDVARRARTLDPEIAVVYVTGGPPTSVAVHGVKGAVLVPKPFTREDLIGALEDAGAAADRSDGENGSAAPLE